MNAHEQGAEKELLGTLLIAAKLLTTCGPSLHLSSFQARAKLKRATACKYSITFHKQQIFHTLSNNIP